MARKIYEKREKRYFAKKVRPWFYKECQRCKDKVKREDIFKVDIYYYFINRDVYDFFYTIYFCNLCCSSLEDAEAEGEKIFG